MNSLEALKEYKKINVLPKYIPLYNCIKKDLQAYNSIMSLDVSEGEKALDMALNKLNEMMDIKNIMSLKHPNIFMLFSNIECRIREGKNAITKAKAMEELIKNYFKEHNIFIDCIDNGYPIELKDLEQQIKSLLGLGGE